MSARLLMSTCVTSARAAPVPPIVIDSRIAMWRIIARIMHDATHLVRVKPDATYWHRTAEPVIMTDHDRLAPRSCRARVGSVLPGGPAELPGTRLPDARAPAHRRRPPRRRRLLVARRQTPRFSKRA